MLLPFLVFVFVTASIMAGYAAVTYLPGMLEARKLDRRLRDVSFDTGPQDENSEDSVIKRLTDGPLPGVDKLISKTNAGSWLSHLIDQSGVHTTPSGIVLASFVIGMTCGAAAWVFVGQQTAMAAACAALVGASAPFFFLVHKRSRRLKRFEEQFPEALDLMSRAIRAGHALQTALGMAGEELPEPVGPEFKKTFDQQNFGLPLRDVLNELAVRVPLLDVRFFVTAVLIQRDTGGNLAEILDNLAHVVRERFKIRRQVRVHTAHGRFTGYVLLALPAALAIALSFINPDHMQLLFRERMGQMMLMGAIVMQTIGFLWIRKVIKIEV
jgi:tight adherence protein B